MIASVVVSLEGLASLGLGLAALRLLRIVAPSLVEHIGSAFALGFGLLGWILFFFGLLGGFTAELLWPLLITCAAGCLFLREIVLTKAAMSIRPIEIVLLVGLACAFGFDLMEALSPPADADTMAYHFALPKSFVEAGRLQFVLRATDGAVPLLVQLTYVPALALGGEQALTLWSLTTGWALVALAYAFARRLLNRAWSLSVAFLLVTTPALVYSGGSGHVEPRTALFAAVGAIAIFDFARTKDLRFAALVGLAAGCFMGSKYTGLLFAFASGFIVLFVSIVRHRRWFLPAAILTGAALVIGGQWYVWNWIHTGDPVFPMLYGLVDYRNPTIWDAAHQEALVRQTTTGEREVPVNLLWLLVYPFVATLNGLPVFESGRTGFGPFVLLIFPLTALAVWSFRREIAKSSLLPFGLVAGLFYVLWFVSGFSQRLRHLLPVYPLLLICVTVAAAHWSRITGIRAPLVCAVVIASVIQLLGHLVFTRNFAAYVLSDESREEFLLRNLPGYVAVTWINRHLLVTDKVITTERDLIYQFEIPVYYAHASNNAQVDVRPEVSNPALFLTQLKAQGVTHILAPRRGPPDGFGINQIRLLTAAGCAERVNEFTFEAFASRTLNTLGRNMRSLDLFSLTSRPCLK